VSLRTYLLRGRVSITTDVIESLDPAMRDERDWVRWNAVNVLVDLGPRNDRPVPSNIKSLIVDSEGQVRLDAAWQFAASPGTPRQGQVDP
jgi:hypothetical protein